MKRLFVIALLCLVGWQVYVRYEAKRLPATQAPVPAIAAQPAALFPGAPASPGAATASLFKCDGRTYCSQMSSCAEATFFLKNCPGTKMDGNNDGIPCEKQWCK
jgi:hypothetical protein